MIDPFDLQKMPYGKALLSIDARNCGLYFVFMDEVLLYIGKASSVTLKRRLAENLTSDNGFNTLTRKVSKCTNKTLNNVDVIP